MDADRWDSLCGRLFGVLTSLDDRSTRREAELIDEFIDLGEFAPALEQMADVLTEDDTRSRSKSVTRCCASTRTCRWAIGSRPSWRPARQPIGR